MNILIRPLTSDFRDWADELLAEHWVSPMIMSRFKWFDTRTLPSLVALLNDHPVGLATYIIENGECELITLNSLVENMGVGSSLISAVMKKARSEKCSRMFLTTGNDNLNALKFYQKRGLRIVAVHVGAIDAAREQETQIPLLGYSGIPMRDELELEIKFS